MKFALCASFAVLALAGCTQERPASAVAPAPVSTGVCQADPAQRFVGQQVTPALVEQVRVASGSKLARRITPEMRVTMEFNAERANVWVGLKGEAERVSCG